MQSSDMKQIIFSSLAIASMFSFISCERHTWEDSSEGAKDGTKNLFPKPEAKHEGHDAHTDHAAESKHGSKHEEGVKAEDHSTHGH